MQYFFTDPISGYESIGGPNHIGSLLEQIKPDVDAGPLSHFDQLYAAEVTTASEGPRGIGENLHYKYKLKLWPFVEKYITTQSQSTSQEPLSFLAQQKPHNTTGSNNIITVGGTPTPPIAAKQNGYVISNHKDINNWFLAATQLRFLLFLPKYLLTNAQLNFNARNASVWWSTAQHHSCTMSM